MNIRKLFNPPSPDIWAVTTDAAANTLFAFAGEGYPPGGFGEKLMALMGAADDNNLSKLLEVFPAEVSAFLIVRNKPGGLDMLRGILFAATNGGDSA